MRDHPDVSVILPQSVVVGELPVVGQAVQGVLRLHSSGHWVLTQAQVLVKQALKPSKNTNIYTSPPKKNASAQLLGNWYEGMALQGRLEEWQDDKGFGFIAVEGAPNQVFSTSVITWGNEWKTQWHETGLSTGTQ